MASVEKMPVGREQLLLGRKVKQGVQEASGKCKINNSNNKTQKGENLCSLLWLCNLVVPLLARSDPELQESRKAVAESQSTITELGEFAVEMQQSDIWHTELLLYKSFHL